EEPCRGCGTVNRLDAKFGKQCGRSVAALLPVAPARSRLYRMEMPLEALQVPASVPAVESVELFERYRRAVGGPTRARDCPARRRWPFSALWLSLGQLRGSFRGEVCALTRGAPRWRCMTGRSRVRAVLALITAQLARRATSESRLAS